MVVRCYTGPVCDLVINKRKRTLLVGLLLFLVVVSQAKAGTTAEEERRMGIGSKLFPSIVSVDMGLKTKLSPKTHALHLAFVYRQRPATLGKHLALLRHRLKTVRKIPVVMETIPLQRLTDQGEVPFVSAVFIADKLSDEDLTALLKITAKRHLVTFSPFEGDVQRGVVAGLYISSRILPYINIHAAKTAGVVFHPMFLKLARHYE